MSKTSKNGEVDNHQMFELRCPQKKIVTVKILKIHIECQLSQINYPMGWFTVFMDDWFLLNRTYGHPEPVALLGISLAWIGDMPLGFLPIPGPRQLAVERGYSLVVGDH